MSFQQNRNIDFQIVALQVVMVDILKGDTIDHALIVQAFGRIVDSHADNTRQHNHVVKPI